MTCPKCQREVGTICVRRQKDLRCGCIDCHDCTPHLYVVQRDE